jgi:hypothetical protein
MSKTIFKKIKNLGRRAQIRMGLTSSFVRKIEQRLEEPVAMQGAHQITLLALQPERFRKDLEILCRHGIKVLHFPQSLQSNLQEIYWNSSVDFEQYYNPPQGSATQKIQTQVQRFLGKVLKELATRQSIDGVVGAALHYIDSWDYIAAAKSVGIPSIIMHRECFQTNIGQFNRIVDLGIKLHRLHANFVIFHNEITRKGFITAGHTKPEESAALGCMRMDAFVRRINKQHVAHTSGRQALMFSFSHCSGIAEMCNSFTDGSLGFVRLFEACHVQFAKLAQKHPEYNFIIKPKWGEEWIEQIDSALKKEGIERDTISNLQILPDADAHDLIFESDVVFGFNSTTLAEAGLAAKPVIIPCFAECLEEQYVDFIQLQAEFDAFDIAYSEKEIEPLILNALRNPEISEKQMVVRRALFERYISSLDARATERYADKLVELTKKHSKTLF